MYKEPIEHVIKPFSPFAKKSHATVVPVDNQTSDTIVFSNPSQLQTPLYDRASSFASQDQQRPLTPRETDDIIITSKKRKDGSLLYIARLRCDKKVLFIGKFKSYDAATEAALSRLAN